MADQPIIKDDKAKLHIIADIKVQSLNRELDDLLKELAALQKNSPSSITLNFACDHLIISIQLLKEVV